jgi:hypothetical protein
MIMKNFKKLNISIMKRSTKLYIIVVSLFLINLTGYAQLAGDSVFEQTPVQEVRKGATSQYSVSAGHVAGEQYTWSIAGGMPTPAPNSGAGTLTDPYIINFTPNLHTISVTWNTDLQAISSLSGNVKVEKRTVGGCSSVIQSLVVSSWTLATATILGADYSICSGDPTTGSVTVAFTGSPNFDFKYTIKELDGTTSAENLVTGITGSTATISLPSNLVNLSTTADQTYVITLTQMNDSFTGNGVILDGTLTITVHPTINTGVIQVSPASLQRR